MSSLFLSFLSVGSPKSCRPCWNVRVHHPDPRPRSQAPIRPYVATDYEVGVSSQMQQWHPSRIPRTCYGEEPRSGTIESCAFLPRRMSNMVVPAQPASDGGSQSFALAAPERGSNAARQSHRHRCFNFTLGLYHGFRTI